MLQVTSRYVTMARISWNASGLLEAVWSTLGVPNGRDELAWRTGIAGTTLSAINTGRRPLTLATAQRIAEAAGVSVAELGAPEGDLDHDGRLLHDRLRSLEEQVERARLAMFDGLEALDARLSLVEKRLELQDAQES